MLEIYLLGTFDLRQAGKSIAIPSRPAQSLLAYLVLNAGTPHRREKLAGLLWPDSLEETARDNLRHALWRVRKAIQSASVPCNLKANDLTISFDILCDYWFDVATLEKLNGTESADELIAVLSGFKGELLPGFYEEWVVLEREHLNSVFDRNMARLMAILQDEKRWLDILDWGERWIKLGQKPEPAYRALMSAHAAKGDMSKVAITYERCVKSLQELGVEPSEQTRELYERLKAGIEIPETGLFAQKKEMRTESPKTNLPTPLTSFIGREIEIREVLNCLEKHRLVTLTGPGGVGKTRLAIQSSKSISTKFKDGVWWVEFAPLTDEALIPQSVAQALGVSESPGQPLTESLKTFLREKNLLLILDNCEHLIDACAQLAHDLLTQCATLKILATSREALGIMGEFGYQVQPLSLPTSEHLTFVDILLDYEGIRLLVERANAKSGFTLTKQNANAVLQICLHLDGIPLAIELAAAQTRNTTIEQVAERLSDRFNLLTEGNRTAMPRHQTLRATIHWSYELLTEPERILFRRLAVFSGSFTLKAIEVICSFSDLKRKNLLDLLGHLVDKSLVMADSTHDSQARYRFLETIREYAFEKLVSYGEADIARDRHLEFFMEMAEEADFNHFSPDQLKWFRRIEADIDNMRAAMDWSTATVQIVDKDVQSWRQQTGLQLVGALVWFWHRSHTREISDRLKYMLAMSDKQTLGRVKSLYSLGFLSWVVNNYEEARVSLEEAVSLSRKLDDRLTLARSLGYLGAVAAAEGDHTLTKSLLKESVSVGRELGLAGRKPVSLALTLLGDVYFEQEDYQLAKNMYEEAVALTREAHEKNLLGLMIRRLGYVALRQLDNQRASEHFEESLRLNQEVKHPLGICAALTAYANLALAMGKSSVAAQLFGAVESALNSSSMQLFHSDKIEFQRGNSYLLGQVEYATLEKAWKKGATMSMEQAIEFAQLHQKTR